ncbi:polysaccharide pyruvyl transferase family protein [Chloroflexota bacterium]
MFKITTIGATLSGNKGAAAMLLSCVDNIPKILDNVSYKILSIYPEEDKRISTDINVEVIAAKPTALLLAIPLACLWMLLKIMHISPNILQKNKILNAIEESDLFIDLSGISFSDGRGIVLAYNVACILPAILMKKPVMKYSQALGPFDTLGNRWLAKTLLPYMRVIASRGTITHKYLSELGLENVSLCADAAFTLHDQSNDNNIAVKLNNSKSLVGREIVGISASSVVRTYCEKKQIDYCRIIARFSDQIIASGKYSVRLIAHAVRESKRGGRTNDIDTCQKIYHQMEYKEYCQLIIEDYTPSELRTIIGNSNYFIASRFHSMVFALSENIPVIVIAWSHKYREVLAMFDLENWAIGYSELTRSNLLNEFEALVSENKEIRTLIQTYLPSVIDSSYQNASIAASLLRTEH